MQTERSGLTKQAVIAELVRSPHASQRRGDTRTAAQKLAEAYLPVGRQAVAEDPEFYAHLVAWNARKGEVKDARAALPVIALGASVLSTAEPAWTENALAHLAQLEPVLLTKKALPFAREAGVPGGLLKRLVRRYLKDLEADAAAWTWAAVQHRAFLKRLYAFYDVPPGGAAVDADVVRAALFGEDRQGRPLAPPPESVFAAVRGLATAPAPVVDGWVRHHRLPFLVVRGAIQRRVAAEPELLATLVRSMSETELVTSAALLNKLGLQANPAARAAYDEVLARKTQRGGRGAAFKATRAAEALEARGAADMAATLRRAQERQLAARAGIDGDWLVLGDKSGSMTSYIDTARLVASALARLVKGRVTLTFFDHGPTTFDVTGRTYEEVRAATGRIHAGGGTNIGCGLRRLTDAGTVVNGVAVVSDGEGADFAAAYQSYCARLGCEPTVYLYLTSGGGEPMLRECRAAGIDVQVFDLRGKAVDSYSVVALAETMRVGRYSLVDEINDTPLLALDDVLTRTRGTRVLPAPVVPSVLVTP